MTTLWIIIAIVVGLPLLATLLLLLPNLLRLLLVTLLELIPDHEENDGKK